MGTTGQVEKAHIPGTLKDGTILRVRGYLRGKEQPYRLAVVIGQVLGHTRVWFFNEGAPEPGSTLQILFPSSKVRLVPDKTLADLPVRTLRRMERQLNIASEPGLYAFGWAVRKARLQAEARQKG